MFFVVLATTVMTLDNLQGYSQSIRSGLSFLASPVFFIVDLPVRLTEATSAALTLNATLKKENKILKQELLHLQSKAQKITALEQENQRLHELFGSSVSVSEKKLIADILSINLDPATHSIMINKGKQDDVYVGQPILDAHGIMGQIIEVNALTSRALLISDINHAIPVQVNRNGYQVIVNGTGLEDALHVRHVPPTADIKTGDLLVSSGLGQRFPAGYPVAKVISIDHVPGLPFTQVIAKPSAKLKYRRQVLLIWPTPKTRLQNENGSPQ